MGGRWDILLIAAVAAVHLPLGRSQLEYNITTTWNGEEIDHPPIQVVLSGSPDNNYLELAIEAPFFDDPPAPPGPAGKAFYGLWDYEVVEAFFLNDDDQYVEVEVCPWGQHIVLLLNGERVTIRHSLPMEVTTSISGDTWSGLARIPVEYLPQNVTKFNAYGIHGSGDNRTYESLYPASENASAPDFHALQYFNDIDLSAILPDQETTMSQFWIDSIDGIFRYHIKTTWNDVDVDHTPVEISLQGFTAGVEMNITAPFFNDPAPDGKSGEPFYGLWDYEVVEMFFLNDNNEYLEVELGPWGQHLLLLLKGARNVLKHSLALDYIVLEKTDPSAGKPGQWKGSAMLPPGYFPPNVTQINAYAIHGSGDDREYQSLYPAPNNDPEYPVPDFHRLELFQPIDFEFQLDNNSYYSKTWQDAMDSAAPALTAQSPVVKEEETEFVTVLGPADVFKPTSAPATNAAGILRAKEVAALLRKPKPQRILPDEQREHRLEDEGDFERPDFGPSDVPTPQLVRMGNREIENSSPNNQQRRPVQHNVRVSDDSLQSQAQGRPFRPPPRTSLEFENQGQPLQPGQFQNQPLLQSQETTFQLQGQPQFHEQDRFSDQNIRHPQRPSRFEEELQFQNQGPPQFQIQEQNSFQNQGHPQFQNQEQSQFQNQGQPQFQNQGQPQFQKQGQPQFQNQGQPQFQNQGQPQFQNQGRPQFQNQGHPQFQNQGHPQFQNQGQPQFQNEGLPQFQNQGQPQFQDENQSQFQTPNTFVFQGQGPPRFQEQGRPPIQFEDPSQFDDPSPPSQSPTFQNQGFEQSIDVPGSQTSAVDPSQDVGLQGIITPDVEQAVITLAEGTPALPPPHPVCFEVGLVPDQDRCYVFHECVLEDGLWKMYSWRCRRGQKFDPLNVACVRGRCSRPQRRRRVRHP